MSSLSPLDEATVRNIISGFVIGDFLTKYLTDTSDNVAMAIELAKERNLTFGNSVDNLRLIPNFHLADIMKTAIDYVAQLRKYETLYTTNQAKIDPEIATISKTSSTKYKDLADLKTAPLLKYYRELDAIIKRLKL